MLKNFLNLVLLVVIQFSYITEAYSLEDLNVKQFLQNREEAWPNWTLPRLKASGTKKDLIYPSWFEGDWVVTSEDLGQSSTKPIIYSVNFFKNQSGEIVANRSKNSEAIGKIILGDDLKRVKSDPKSFNNQIIYLSDNQYIESRITGRSQFSVNDLFFSDEFIIQTVHKPDISRVNQVEIMSKFYKCKENNFVDSNNLKSNICGYQYSATYGSRVGDTSVNAITSNKYKLTFKPLESLH